MKTLKKVLIDVIVLSLVFSVPIIFGIYWGITANIIGW